MLYQLDTRVPQIATSSWVAPGAIIIGDVSLAEQATVWFGCVLRGDLQPITIGARSNIQDLTMMHVGLTDAIRIGEDVTIGHKVMIHGCAIEDRCLIGMGTTVLDGARIQHDSLVAAGSLVLEGATFPPYSLIAGRPAKAVKPLTDAQRILLSDAARFYVEEGTHYRDTLKRYR